MFELTLELIYLLAIIFLGVSVMIGFFWLQRSVPEIDEDDRTYLDPLPPGLAIFWPLILAMSMVVEIAYSNAYLDRIDRKLQKTGVGYMLNAEQFVALRYLSALVFFLLAAFIVLALRPEQGTGLIITLCTLGGFFFPLVWLEDTRKRRELAVIKALPVYLDFTTMAVEAGLNLSGALQQAMNKGPDGPLRNEFAILMRDLRAGVTRADALKRMAERLDIADINSFVNAMIQSEKTGSSMATALRIQSEQRRSERFQRAEKKAMEAPVKLVFPLIVFIFPVTFMVLGFPIAMKFLEM